MHDMAKLITLGRSGGGGEGPNGLLGGSVHVEDTALGVLQLQPARGQSRGVVAEQRPCAADAAGRTLCARQKHSISAVVKAEKCSEWH